VPSDINASAIVSQPFSSANVNASASAASAPVANSAIPAARPGRSSRGQHHRQNGKRHRTVEMRDAGIERDQ
jgi:hypothetical protein